jgi:hypothetical protein
MQSGSQDGLSVFVGDSPSDLAALTAADVGIVIGSRPLLRSVASAAGLVLQPLVAGAHPSSLPPSPSCPVILYQCDQAYIRTVLLRFLLCNRAVKVVSSLWVYL